MGLAIAPMGSCVDARVSLAYLTDDEVVAEARRRNPAALSALVDRFQDTAMGFAYLMLHNRHDAEDAVQTAWVRVLGSIHQFRGTGKFTTWLYAIVLNECRKHYRRCRIPQTSLSTEIEAVKGHDTQYVATPGRFDCEYENREIDRLIRHHISLLPTIYRQILVLRYLKHLPLRQMARVLRISEPAAKSRVMRARFELRSRLGNLTLKVHAQKEECAPALFDSSDR